MLFGVGSKSLKDTHEPGLVVEDVSKGPLEALPTPEPLPALPSHQPFPSLLFPTLLYRTHQDPMCLSTKTRQLFTSSSSSPPQTHGKAQPAAMVLDTPFLKRTQTQRGGKNVNIH